MLRQVSPGQYARKPGRTSASDFQPTIDAMLLQNEKLPHRERKSVAAIFRSLQEQHSYHGGYGSVLRYCNKVRTSEWDVEVRPVGPVDAIESLAIRRGPRSYRLEPWSQKGAATLSLRLRRDVRSEQAMEAGSWIDQLRGGRLKTEPRGDPDTVRELLVHVHDQNRRTRNRAIAILAHEQGLSIRQIAAWLPVSRNTARRYIRVYRDGGIEQLLAPMKKGVLGVEREDLKEAVFRVLHEPPKVHGINRTSWKMPDLRAVLSQQGFPVCLQILRQIIKDAGWKWRKARIALTSQDPTYRDKLAAVQATLSNLGADEAFFSIDEFGPFAVKMKQGLMLDPPGPHRIVPQWQKSKGCMIMTAALELSGNQVTHFYSERKNTTEMIRMMDLLLVRYADRRTIYLSWDAASWHISKKLKKRIEEHNHVAESAGQPRVETAPLPAGAQFLNVIESVFSGMARAILHNSDYPSADAARSAIDAYFAERNRHFQEKPKRAGKRIWGEERVAPTFSDSNNCKDPRWR
jgi:transposase